MQGPAINLTPFLGDLTPFDTLSGLADWAAALNYRALQLPTWDDRALDAEAVLLSEDYVAEIRGILARNLLELAALSVERQSWILAAHPVYGPVVEGIVPEERRADPAGWARDEIRQAIAVCKRLGVKALVTLSGSLAWPLLGLRDDLPPGLVDTAFAELGARWEPLLDEAAEAGVDLCFAPRPGQDVHDGYTFERLLAAVGDHPSCRLAYNPATLLMEQVDYLEFLDLYRDRIRLFHVSDAEFVPGGKSGMSGLNRAVRYRTVGSGQADLSGVFTKLAEYRYNGWAVLDWADPLQQPAAAAREGAGFISAFLLPEAPAGPQPGAPDEARNRRMLGLG